MNFDNFKEFVRESQEIIYNFLKPSVLNNDFLKVPKNIKKIGNKFNAYSLACTLLATIFAFFLKATNMLIEMKFIMLGIMCFMLYYGQEVAKTALQALRRSENKSLENEIEKEILLKAGEVISQTSNKILMKDPKSGLFKTMSGEETLNTFESYTNTLWRYKIQHKFDICQLISIVIMLVAAILTNTSIEQKVFVPLILFFAALSFLTGLYTSVNQKSYLRNLVDHNNSKSVLVNDLLRCPQVVPYDAKMRLNRLQLILNEGSENVSRFQKVSNISELISSVFEVASQYGIILLYLCKIDFNTINVGTIAELTANIAIVKTVLNQIKVLVDFLRTTNERLVSLNQEEEKIRLILEVFDNVNKSNSNCKKISEIVLSPFKISYAKNSANDRPFELFSEEEIAIEVGDVAILYGSSGSGKSTFMKMLTERVKLEKNADIPVTSRYLFFDETMGLGNLSLFEELFCGEMENSDLKKMQIILEGLHLWIEIQNNCSDVWSWLREKNFNQSLSNGQKQRLVLAKMLYWLDDGIDCVALDECTSGLDDRSNKEGEASAQDILEFAVRYINKERKRIVIIATHQNLDEFQESLKDICAFKIYDFERTSFGSVVRRR